jgi:hypothetical protein
MGTEDLQRKSLKRRLLSCVAAIALIGNTMAPFSTAVAQESPTLTPIKHVIVIIGENRTFDHIFATYKPVNKGEKVLNFCRRGSSRPMVRRGRITGRPCAVETCFAVGQVSFIGDGGRSSEDGLQGQSSNHHKLRG